MSHICWLDHLSKDGKSLEESMRVQGYELPQLGSRRAMKKEPSWRTAECGTIWKRKLLRCRMAKTNGSDEIGEAKMLYKEDKRAHCIKEEIGSQRHVQRKIRLFSSAEQGKGEDGLLITTDTEEQHDTLAGTYLEQEHGGKKICFEIIR